jgi:hypothetical protein
MYVNNNMNVRNNTIYEGTQFHSHCGIIFYKLQTNSIIQCFLLAIKKNKFTFNKLSKLKITTLS